MLLRKREQYDIVRVLQYGVDVSHGSSGEYGAAPAAGGGQRPYGPRRGVRPAVQDDAAAAQVAVGVVESVEPVGCAVTAGVTFGHECMPKRGEVAAVDIREAGVCRGLVRPVAAAAVTDGVAAQGLAGIEIPYDETPASGVSSVVYHDGNVAVVAVVDAVLPQPVGVAAPSRVKPHCAVVPKVAACPPRHEP